VQIADVCDTVLLGIDPKDVAPLMSRIIHYSTAHLDSPKDGGVGKALPKKGRPGVGSACTGG